jgi:alkanesulfonate monooxygenase SsuD/methylene tetrahydromethanopterin reductase-like flavin-dependent oxidoreductase (luciferase family)
MHYETVKHELYPETAELEDFSYARVERFASFVAGEPVRKFSGKQGVVEEFSNRVEPHSPGLRGRLWYGAGSRKSAAWAGANGFNLLPSACASACSASLWGRSRWRQPAFPTNACARRTTRQ